ncbi:MAG: molybdenum cofactor guanylyltransferase [Gammaproteobacteria bacterium]|nr:MAG: molybdenum cofactor guanylyltransferase [Gammaproteobacteria bacterium]
MSLIPGLGVVVLAGGLGRRLQGQDKGLVTLGGIPMAAHVLQAMVPVSERIVINANRNHERYFDLVRDMSESHDGLSTHLATPPVVADTMPDYPGPLAGLLTGLRTLDTDFVFMCPCDSPFIGPELPKRLLASLESVEADVAVPFDGTREQPIFLLVRRACLASLEAFLAAGERKIDLWYQGEEKVAVPAADLCRMFVNINTEDDRGAAEAWLRTGGVREVFEADETWEAGEARAAGEVRARGDTRKS